MYGPKEVPGSFVVAAGDGAPQFQPSEKVLGQMAACVEVPVDRAFYQSSGLRWNDCGDVSWCKPIKNTRIGVVTSVGNKCFGLKSRQHCIGTIEIMGMLRREDKVDGIAQRVAYGVNLRAQPAPGPTDGFTWAPFFLAPALAWCARTMVESVMAYLLSESALSALKTRSQTQVWAQREWRRWMFFQTPNRSGRSRHGIPAR